jgi:uncharacterized protein
MSNVDVIRSAYEAFGRGDLAAVLAALDPDIEWQEADGSPLQPSGAPWVGPDAVAENLFARLEADWDGLAVQPRELRDAGDAVVAEGRWAGTFRATGKSLDAQFCHVFRVADGKVTSFQQYTDTAQLLEVMGLR